MSRETEPSEEVWKAVAELEKQFYTKKEIARILHGVADDVSGL